MVKITRNLTESWLKCIASEKALRLRELISLHKVITLKIYLNHSRRVSKIALHWVIKQISRACFTRVDNGSDFLRSSILHAKIFTCRAWERYPRKNLDKNVNAHGSLEGHFLVIRIPWINKVNVSYCWEPSLKIIWEELPWEWSSSLGQNDVQYRPY